MNPELDVSDVVERLGGTSAVARMMRIKPASVSEWKAKNQIPPARLMCLKLMHPHLFDGRAGAGTESA